MSLTDDLAARILAELADIKARLPALTAVADRSLTRRQAADYLGIHPKTLALMTSTAGESGKVTGYRDGSGGRWKYRESELARYRETLTQGARPRANPCGSIDWSQ